jgi:hypothetical protein
MEVWAWKYYKLNLNNGITTAIVDSRSPRVYWMVPLLIESCKDSKDPGHTLPHFRADSLNRRVQTQAFCRFHYQYSKVCWLPFEMRLAEVQRWASLGLARIWRLTEAEERIRCLLPFYSILIFGEATFPSKMKLKICLIVSKSQSCSSI